MISWPEVTKIPTPIHPDTPIPAQGDQFRTYLRRDRMMGKEEGKGRMEVRTCELRAVEDAVQMLKVVYIVGTPRITDHRFLAKFMHTCT